MNKNENNILDCNDNKNIKANSNTLYDFHISEDEFSEIKEGKYKIIIYINGQKAQKCKFKITYK